MEVIERYGPQAFLREASARAASTREPGMRLCFESKAVPAFARRFFTTVPATRPSAASLLQRRLVFRRPTDRLSACVARAENAS